MTHLGRAEKALAPTSLPTATSAATLAKRAGLVVLAAAVLFFCYWRQSQAAPLPSDGSGNVLQAWDMLHGNLLLHNWWVSDVSFYTTELPQYMLIEALTGLGPWVVHVAAAMTYTLLVLLAALLAKGNARGGQGAARALLAAGLMLAPQLSATSILLLSPDHIGTAVPLLAIWLLIDRARPRWYVPVLVCLLFTWTMVADSIVLLTGIVPLMLVGAGRAFAGLIRRGGLRASRWYELSLVGAAAVAGVAGSYGPRVMAALGGYQQSPVGTDTDLHQLQHGAWVTFQAFLELFGANVFNTSFLGTRPALEVVFVALHLAGAIVAACALGVGIARIFRFGELIVPVFAVAIVVNLVAYMISTHAQDLLGAREMAEVLPLGAVLAGRVLGDRIAAWTGAAKRWLAPVLAVLGPATSPRSDTAPRRLQSRPLTSPWPAGWWRTGSRTGWPPTGRPTAPPWTAAARSSSARWCRTPATGSRPTSGRPTTRTTTWLCTTRTSSWRTAPPRCPACSSPRSSPSAARSGSITPTVTPS